MSEIAAKYKERGNRLLYSTRKSWDDYFITSTEANIFLNLVTVLPLYVKNYTKVKLQLIYLILFIKYRNWIYQINFWTYWKTSIANKNLISLLCFPQLFCVTRVTSYFLVMLQFVVPAVICYNFLTIFCNSSITCRNFNKIFELQ